MLEDIKYRRSYRKLKENAQDQEIDSIVLTCCKSFTKEDFCQDSRSSVSLHRAQSILVLYGTEYLNKSYAQMKLHIEMKL